MLTKNEKLGHKGVWSWSRDLLLNFRTPLLFPVRMKLQTSSFAAGSRVRNTTQKMKNWAKKGRGIGHVTYFCFLGPPIIFGQDEGRNFKFCSRIEGKEY